MLFPFPSFQHLLLRDPSWIGVTWVTKPFCRCVSIVKGHTGLTLFVNTNIWYKFAVILLRPWTFCNNHIFLHTGAAVEKERHLQCLTTTPNNVVPKVCLRTDTICCSPSGTWNRSFYSSSRGGEEMFVTWPPVDEVEDEFLFSTFYCQNLPTGAVYSGKVIQLMVAWWRPVFSTELLELERFTHWEKYVFGCEKTVFPSVTHKARVCQVCFSRWLLCILSFIYAWIWKLSRLSTCIVCLRLESPEHSLLCCAKERYSRLNFWAALEDKRSFLPQWQNAPLTDRSPSPSAVQYTLDPTSVLLIRLQNIWLPSHVQSDLLHKENMLLTEYK